MATILDELKTIIDSRITNKTAINSISPVNVGESLKDIVDELKLKVPSLTKRYPAGFVARDSNYNIFICRLDNSTGDLQDPNKWKRLIEEFKYEVVINADNQTQFNLNPIPLNINLVSLYLNGQRQYLGRDFSVNNLGVLTFTSIPVETTDALCVEYLGYNN